MLIDGTPEMEDFALHLDHSLLEMRLVAGFGSIATDDVGEQWPKPLLPLADGLMADINAALGEDVLDIAKAQAETKRKSDGLANDLTWKTVPLEGVNG